MNSKKHSGVRSEGYAAKAIKAKPPSPTTDVPDAAAAAAATAAADPTILQQELAAQQDDYLRLAADFDNFRKRTRRDSEQQAAAEKESFIRDLLPVLDNLERALASTQATATEPLTMTLQQLGQLLHRHGIEAVADMGRPFDPHRHEAVAVRHDPSQPDQIVLEVIQNGYNRGGKVFRPAKVIVNDLSHSPGANYAG